MEAALHHHALDRASGVLGARVGLQLGVDVGDARGQADRFGTGVQAQELGERAAAAAVADLLAQGPIEAQLRQARGHDVGHGLRLGHRLQHRRRGVAEADHAVAAGVVQHRAVEGHQPWPARGQGDVGIDRVLGVEVDVAALHGAQLRVFVQVEQVGEFVAQAFVFGGRGADRGFQVRVRLGQAQQRGVVQAEGHALAGMGAQRREFFDQVHGFPPADRR